MAVIYQHRRSDTNQVFYVGIGKTTKRAYSVYNRNIHWRHIVGKVDYVVEVLQENLTWEDACKEETRLIALHGRSDLKKGYLVNQTDGGEGSVGLIFSEKHKLKISKANTGRFISEEWKRRMSAAQKGKVKKPLSEEHKSKLSRARLGKKASDETKQSMSEAAKSRKRQPHTEEAKQNMSKAKLGNNISQEHLQRLKKMADNNRGRKQSEETKRKKSEAWKNRALSNKSKMCE